MALVITIEITLKECYVDFRKINYIYNRPAITSLKRHVLIRFTLNFIHMYMEGLHDHPGLQINNIIIYHSLARL